MDSMEFQLSDKDVEDVADVQVQTNLMCGGEEVILHPWRWSWKGEKRGEEGSGE